MKLVRWKREGMTGRMTKGWEVGEDVKGWGVDVTVGDDDAKGKGGGYKGGVVRMSWEGVRIRI